MINFAETEAGNTYTWNDVKSTDGVTKPTIMSGLLDPNVVLNIPSI